MNHNDARPTRTRRITNIGGTMNVKTRTSIGIALALGALAVPASGMNIYDTPATSSPLGDAGRTTYQPVPSTQVATPVPTGDDHARTDQATASPSVPVGDDHARTDQATASPSVPVGDDHARRDSLKPKPVPAVSTPLVTDSGFDWTDAGIGFATAAGIALLGGGSFAVTRRSRRIAGV